VSGREEPESYVHADVAVGEVLVPCACDVVAVGGALEPCRSTTAGLMGPPSSWEHAGCHHYLFY
jgi:hypothetical protein